MYNKKLVSDSLVNAARGILTGQQKDAADNELKIGSKVKIQEGDYSGCTGVIQDFKSSGTSQVQLDRGRNIIVFNDTLLNEEFPFQKKDKKDDKKSDKSDKKKDVPDFFKKGKKSDDDSEDDEDEKDDKKSKKKSDDDSDEDESDDKKDDKKSKDKSKGKKEEIKINPKMEENVRYLRRFLGKGDK
jgi:hypothetical protein